MKLLTFEHDQRMRANGVANASRAARAEDTEDYQPAVKLFCPWGAGTWLLTELDPEDPDIAFGLCDLGMGFPELGRVSLMELKAVVGPGGLRIERDLYFKPEKTLQGYADEAHELGRITA